MDRDRFAAFLRPRVRLFVGAAAVGAVVGIFGVFGLLMAGNLRFASRKAFAFGALLLGFGLLGWSGSVIVGDGFEAIQRHLDVSTGWTERASRRAMARIGAAGAGVMAGSSVATALLS